VIHESATLAVSPPPVIERSYWLGRFRVAPGPDASLLFHDRLQPRPRMRPASDFAGLVGGELALELLRQGFLDGCLPPATAAVADRPARPGDPMFWQFPCRTEGAAQALHARRAPRRDGTELHTYLGLPWATWLDMRRQVPDVLESVPELEMQRIRLGGLHGAVREAGGRLRVHTVCQHIAWRDLLPLWQAIGVTDVWLSHLPSDPAARQALMRAGLQGHPWRLFAVNVEDPARRAGLDIGRDPAQRRWLASFVGAHAAHYVSDIRLRLRALAATPDLHIVLREGWHFEQVVYGHQIGGAPAPAGLDDDVRRYNELLTDSVFALCPSGAGPNTLRLWEALAAGTVPVLLGEMPVLPAGGTLPTVDWDAIVLRVPDAELAGLPDRLRAVPLDEVRRRQRLGLEAFAQVREQCCF
jgi:hypothetical protein